MKQCEHCPDAAPDGKRFCKKCEKIVLQELYDSGTLAPRIHHRNRDRDKTENTRETKFGRD